MLLESRGHHVLALSEGESAAARAQEARPDVVLIDIGLPGIDGYEVARRIRTTGQPGTPVLIALTGYGRAEDRRRALAAGFDHHLVKPIDPIALERLLTRLPPP
jgi:CheY-like chemotaxis protein